MNVTLRHQLQQDGRVIITTGGDTPLRVHVPASEARRFAWSILADLDPEEAANAGCPLFETIPGVKRSESEKPQRAPWGSQLERICIALKDGPLDTAQIAQALDITRQQAAVQLSKLRSVGVVQMGGERSYIRPAVWRLGDVSYADYMASRRTRMRTNGRASV